MKLTTLTSFCFNCGAPVRYECKQDDEGVNNEACNKCKPHVAKLANSQMKMMIAEAELARIDGKTTAEARAIRTICRERIIEGDLDRKRSLDELMKIKLRTKPSLEDAQLVNKYLYLT